MDAAVNLADDNGTPGRAGYRRSAGSPRGEARRRELLDRVMPAEHGRRLAGLLPQGRLTEIDDSYTLIPLDQPARLAQAIQDFGDELETGPSRHETQRS